MEGMILAAGLGTRLRPLTDHCPKALVKVGDRTLLDLAIERLSGAGVEHIVVNVHHFADMVENYILSHTWPCRISLSDERRMLLDTGGALSHAAPLFSGRDEVLVHNVDILTDIDLQALCRWHRAVGNLATLCARRRHTRRMLSFRNGLLVGRAPDGQVENGCEALAFSGVSIVSPRLFDLLPAADTPFPIIDEYLRLGAAGHRIGTFIHNPTHWLDVGKPETLKQAEQWTVS